MENDIFCLKIADFKIKLVFGPTNQPELKKNFIRSVKVFFKGFVAKPTETNYDFLINVSDMESQELQYSNLKKHYTLFYENITKKKIQTFYTISISQFQLLIQNVIYQLLSYSNGFLLHSSAVAVGGKAYVFLGVSGAGKSTTVQLLKNNFQSLSDDLSIVRKINNEYFYFQHPFRETNEIKGRTFQKKELGKVFFLNKSPLFSFNASSSLDERSQIMLQQLFSPNDSSIKTALRFASEFKNFYDLYFAKDERKMVKLILSTTNANASF